jgi:beta-lactamase class A
MSPDSASDSNSNYKFRKIIAILLIAILVGVMFSSSVFKGPFKSGQAFPDGQVLGISFSGISSFFNFNSSFSFIFKSQGLAKIVEENLSDKSGEYAIYIADLTDGENYSRNASISFPSASLYKLYLMAAVVKEVESGELTMESEVSARKEHLEEVFEGTDFGYEEAGEVIGYPVEEALERVGRVSDNFASIILAEEIGWDSVQEIANTTGATQTMIKSPITTSADDIANFFQLLYQKKVVSESGSEKIMEFLKLNQLNNRIPAGVPEEVEVIHKTGELSRVRHDAGIVYLSKRKAGSAYLENRPYLIVLMSKDLKDENEAIETMAQISKDVYEYFHNK